MSINQGNYLIHTVNASIRAFMVCLLITVFSLGYAANISTHGSSLSKDVSGNGHQKHEEGNRHKKQQPR
jgi:hypothetical protein